MSITIKTQVISDYDKRGKLDSLVCYLFQYRGLVYASSHKQLQATIIIKQEKNLLFVYQSQGFKMLLNYLNIYLFLKKTLRRILQKNFSKHETDGVANLRIETPDFGGFFTLFSYFWCFKLFVFHIKTKKILAFHRSDSILSSCFFGYFFEQFFLYFYLYITWPS